MGAPEPGPSRVLSHGLPRNLYEPVAHDDSEYEYEYDEEQTEDYYFTLDLSCNPRTIARAQAILEAGDEDQSISNGPPHAKGTPQDGTTMSGSWQNGQLEAVDLHTNEPIIKLDGTSYRCKWSTDLGTQLYITEPRVTKDPRRPGNVLDVVAMSRARLAGKPTIMQRPQNVSFTATSSSTAATALTINGTVSINTTGLSDIALTQGGLDPHIQRARFAEAAAQTRDPLQKVQANFLERFSAIKQMKGEEDLVPVFGVRRYTPPQNKEEIRKRGMEASLHEEPPPKRAHNRKDPNRNDPENWPYNKPAPAGYFTVQTSESPKDSRRNSGGGSRGRGRGGSRRGTRGQARNGSSMLHSPGSYGITDSPRTEGDLPATKADVPEGHENGDDSRPSTSRTAPVEEQERATLHIETRESNTETKKGPLESANELIQVAIESRNEVIESASEPP